jgi:heme oxygenase (biliverdin-IX-beta and delta-forming)
MTTQTLEAPVSRAKRIKAATTRDHDNVNDLVMQAKPFDSHDRYVQFLHLQHIFHGAIEGLYKDTELNRRLPGLDQLPRFDAVRSDLADLGQPLPEAPAPAPVNGPFEALGWLYCSEGSNLGAAFLFKETQQLGLSETHGARHLAAHPGGRGLHWRQFIALLDSQELDAQQEQQAIQGAIDAFDFYRSQVRNVFV